MKKNIILWLAVSAVVMLALPWLAVTFVNGDAGMAVCFLLFSLFGIVYPMKMGKAICIAGDGQIFFYKYINHIILR